MYRLPLYLPEMLEKEIHPKILTLFLNYLEKLFRRMKFECLVPVDTMVFA